MLNKIFSNICTFVEKKVVRLVSNLATVLPKPRLDGSIQSCLAASKRLVSTASLSIDVPNPAIRKTKVLYLPTDKATSLFEQTLLGTALSQGNARTSEPQTLASSGQMQTSFGA